MKRTIVLMACLALYQTDQAQLPNANFEQWSVMANGKDSAINWSSSNSVVIGMNVSLLKETPGYQGTSSAHVITAPFGFVQYSTIGILVNGDATFSYGGGGGGANVAYESGGGTPLNVKPSSLKGFFKYETLTLVDQGMAIILMTKYNTVQNKRDTVSLATQGFLPTAAYTAFEIALPDMMPGTIPDTITTIFYSSNPVTVPANAAFSDLFLDSLSLSGPVVVKPVANFTADILNGITNSVVTFTDNSTNTPTAWQWTVSPATIAYQAGTTNISANPKIKFTAPGDYTIKLSASNTAGADSLTKVNYIHIQGDGTGIEDPVWGLKRAIYPNPASNKLNLTIDFKGADIKLVSIEGKTIATYQKVTGGSIDISALPDGLYFVHIALKGKQVTEKLLIQKK